MKKCIHGFAVAVLLVGGLFLAQGEAESSGSSCQTCSCEDLCFNEYYNCLEQGGHPPWCQDDYFDCLTWCE